MLFIDPINAHMSRQAQMMCPGYQSGTYNITIYGSMDQVVNRIGPKLYTQGLSQARSDNETHAQIETEMMLTCSRRPARVVLKSCGGL